MTKAVLDEAKIHYLNTSTTGSSSMSLSMSPSASDNPEPMDQEEQTDGASMPSKGGTDAFLNLLPVQSL